MESWRRNPRVFWVLNLPPAFWLVVFFLAPLAIVWVISFGERRGPVEIEITWTLENYLRSLDPLYLGIFFKSLWYAGLTTALCLVVAFPIAFGISFAPSRWKPVLLLLIILPFWTNLLIRTYALIAMLRAKGFINYGLEGLWDFGNGLLAVVGLGDLQLLGESYRPFSLVGTQFAVIFGLVYVHLPFMVLPLYASLEKMDHSYIEASLDLGAGQARTFFSIVVPLAKVGIVSGIIITLIPALGSFLTPDLLGGKKVLMIANVIDNQFKDANDWPFGAALSLNLMYITFFVLALRVLWSKGSQMEAG
ncbi:MAG: ABC transporter permease [Kiloniellales bacterium]|nr:ABC transporter permease [Kiloniellales bacterium]